MTLKRIFLLGGVAVGVALTAPAQTTDAIIARARAYLGGDAALTGINSVHFSGVLETDPVAPAGLKPEKFGIDIIFQKPYQQRIVATSAELVETTTLDGYVAWHRIQGLSDRSRWQVSMLDPGQIKAWRANTWENLEFFKGIERRGGRVEVLGPATVDGRPAVKLAFTHDEGIVFYRYFDPATGRLLLSETAQGNIREEGEIMVNGVRFPQKTIQTSKGLDAKGQPVELKQVLTFNKITVNETFPESDFELPLLGPSGPPPAASPSIPAAASPGSAAPPAPGPAGK